jgi:anaerobic magnesium-protoporphyrin IX monomethyl ester cyclase
MEALLINSYNYSSAKRGEVGYRKRQPLDLAYISAYLESLTIDSEIIDAAALQMKNDELLQIVRERAHHIIVVTTSSIDRWECPRVNIDDTLSLIKQMRTVNRNCKIIVYGSHVTTDLEWMINKCQYAVDFFVRGEPEAKAFEIAKYLAGRRDDLQIPGIAFKTDSAYHSVEGDLLIEDLDQLPMPNYSKLPMEIYEYEGDGLPSPFSVMMSSRGCPFGCTFCLRAMSPRYRVRSASRVADEVDYLHQRFGIRSIFFQDWEFLINKERARRIAEELLRRNIQINYGINARATDVDKEVIDLLRRSGLTRINFGLESASDKILGNVNKKITKSDIQTAMDICKHQDVIAGYYTIFNLPGENIRTIRETAELIARNQVEFRPGFVRYYPGTRLAHETGTNWDSVFEVSGHYRTQFHSERVVLLLFRLFHAYYSFKIYPRSFLSRHIGRLAKKLLRTT